MERLDLDLFDDPRIEDENDVMLAGRDTGTGTATSCEGGGSESEGEAESSGGVTVIAVAGVDCDEMTAYAGGAVIM